MWEGGGGQVILLVVSRRSMYITFCLEGVRQNLVNESRSQLPPDTYIMSSPLGFKSKTSSV